MNVPTEDNVAEYVEEILLSEEAPEYLRSASYAFWSACVRAVRERVAGSVTDCGKCLGCCCYVFDRIDVIKPDIDRMAAGGLVPSEFVDMYPIPTIKGVVGTLKKVVLIHPISGEEVSSCPAFDGFKCTIYDHRPVACSDFPMIGCDKFEPREAE